MTTSYIVRFFFSAGFRSTWAMFWLNAVSWSLTRSSTLAPFSSS